MTRVSAVSHAPFEGDLAAARHLCRTFHSRLYPEADPLQAAQVDHWVDQAASMEASNKDAKQVLKNLNQTLGQVSVVGILSLRPPRKITLCRKFFGLLRLLPLGLLSDW